MPTFQAPNEEDDEEEEDEEEEEGGAEDDFETAWDTLDISRIIFEKSDDKETRLKLADVHLCLGDVSLETGKRHKHVASKHCRKIMYFFFTLEKFNEALTDYESAIQIKKELLAEDDRELAEAHYKYALALEFSTEKSDQAIPQLENAIAVLNKRIASLETCQKGKEKEGEGNNASKEIDEINELIPDMKLKVREEYAMENEALINK
jgi:tetratricopeptide (TPR) repeat protein